MAVIAIAFNFIYIKIIITRKNKKFKIINNSWKIREEGEGGGERNFK